MSLLQVLAAQRRPPARPRASRPVIVAGVEWVDVDGRDRLEGVSVDVDLSAYFVDASAVRLVGRSSSAQIRRVRLNSRARRPLLGPWVRLPMDVRPGDRLELAAVPRPGAATAGSR